MNTSRHRGGYTLIELMVTLFILAILAAMVVPNVKPIIAGLEMKSAARQLFADLHYAKIAAMEKQKMHCFAVNGTSGWVIIEDTDSSGACDINGTTDTKLKTFSLIENYPNIIFSGTGNNPIKFDNMGLVGNSAKTLKLHDPKYNKDANVTISPIGFISIE